MTFQSTSGRTWQYRPQSDLRLWGFVDHSTTATRGSTTPKPAPRGIGGCVWREASIEAVRFRCKVYADSRIHSLLTQRNLRDAGWRLKRAFRFRKVLWLLSSKEGNNKKSPCSKQYTPFASRCWP
jgi:hypothetical protein